MRILILTSSWQGGSIDIPEKTSNNNYKQGKHKSCNSHGGLDHIQDLLGKAEAGG